jgi:hypothetical protein
MNLKTLNRKGRPKGALNKNTAEIKEKLTQIIDQIIDEIDLESLNDIDKIKYLTAIMPYAIGKMTTDVNVQMSENSNVPFLINQPGEWEGKQAFILDNKPVVVFEN